MMWPVQGSGHESGSTSDAGTVERGEGNNGIEWSYYGVVVCVHDRKYVSLVEVEKPGARIGKH